MSVYTVHEPPLRAAEALPNPERFAFVRDGFSWWAFLVSALWMLWHRMWLVLVIYLAVVVGVEAALRHVGASGVVVAVVGLVISFLVGIEAGTLRRFTLARRGWKNVAVVSGDDVEEAERRFFDVWVSEAPHQRGAPPSASGPSAPPTQSGPPPPAPAPRGPPEPAPEVIGLFPEPGANR